MGKSDARSNVMMWQDEKHDQFDFNELFDSRDRLL
jgi:hypothetical protein